MPFKSTFFKDLIARNAIIIKYVKLMNASVEEQIYNPFSKYGLNMAINMESEKVKNIASCTLANKI